MNRAWSTFEVKSFDDDARTFEGIASTPQTDRVGDIVEPLGAKFKLPLTMLWEHGKGFTPDPVGWITHADPREDGIFVKGRFAKLDEPPSLKDDLDRAWALVRSGLTRGLSIGFKPRKREAIKGTFGERFMEWEWLELSPVKIAANSDASIQTVKAMDLLSLAASGDMAKAYVSLTISPPASRKPNEGKAMNVKEQILAFEAKRAANAAAMNAIMQKTVDEGRSTESAEAIEFDRLQDENQRIDEDLIRWRSMEQAEKVAVAAAKDVPAEAGASEEKSLRVRRGDGVLRPNENLPKGIGLARYVKALAFAKGNNTDAQMYAQQWQDSTPEVLEALKSAVAAGTTAHATWAGPLVYAENLSSEFLEFLRPQTILGKLTGLHRVPFNIRFATTTTGSTVGWVGEGLGKPVSAMAFSSMTLGFAKAAGIVVITQELARYSSPSAELVVRNDMAAQMRYFLDLQFIDPGVAAVANVNPASVLNGASNVVQSAAAWTTMATVVADVKNLLNGFAANDIALDGQSYWIMTPATALVLSLIMTAGGENFAFPGITVSGGTFLGLPVIVSNSVPHSTSAGSIVALIKADEILLADEGGIAIDASTEASLLMDTAPTTQTSATPTGSSVVSMFQTNSIAIRCERVINWARRRAYGVGYIDNVH